MFNFKLNFADPMVFVHFIIHMNHHHTLKKKKNIRLAFSVFMNSFHVPHYNNNADAPRALHSVLNSNSKRDGVWNRVFNITKKKNKVLRMVNKFDEQTKITKCCVIFFFFSVLFVSLSNNNLIACTSDDIKL